MNFELIVLKNKYAVAKLPPNVQIPTLVYKSPFYSITRSSDEQSIVCQQDYIESSITHVNRDWRVLKIAGPLDFSIIGIIAGLSAILKENDISVFTISTYNTDYFLVKNDCLNKAIDALTRAGHFVSAETPD